MDSVKPNFKQKIIDFWNTNFEVGTTKKLQITGVIITAVMLIISILDYKAFTSLEKESKWFLLALSLIMPFIVGLTVIVNIRIKKEKLNNILHFVFFFLMPIPIITVTECLNGIFIYNMTYAGFFANYVVVMLLLLIIYALTGSFKAPLFTVTPILYALAVANSYVMDFRGTPFIPMDFLSIKTAVGVASTYKYKLTDIVWLATIVFVWIMVVSAKIKTPKYNIKTKIIGRSVSGAFCATVLILFYGTNILANMGVKPDFWNQARGYHNYGFSYMFLCNTKYLFMAEPNGYDPDKLEGYVDHIVNKPEQETPDKNPDSDKKPPKDTSGNPNIICIMNESLADLKVLGDFETNEDYMPFMHSLTKNTIKGNVYVPVIGAGTSNTEFEFLTGHSTAFLPTGSNAYMLYIKKPIASLVSTLEGQNYSSYSLHPYYAAGWNRINVYKNMGFDLFESIENLLVPEMMQEYRKNSTNPEYLSTLQAQYYPNDNLLLRTYISDEYDFKHVIKNYENRDKSKPYFAFNVTMQNHGGYTTHCSNFEERIHVTSSPNTYEKVNEYLSLVKYTDEAFEELLNYFSNVSEPTIICMFGDHHPKVENEFLCEVLGVNSLSNLTPEQEQNRHITPFFIWANYKIDEQVIDRISVNYLHSLVLKTAGVKLTPYNEYLLKLMEELPVIDTVGYIDSEDNYYRWSSKSEYTDKINEYEQIQYNNIFDSGNKDTDLFYLEGYTGDEGHDVIAETESKQEKAIDKAAGKN